MSTAEGAGDAPAEQPTPEGLELAKTLARSVVARGVPDSGKGGARGARSRGTSASRRGGKARVSGAHPDERDPQTLDVVLGRLVADHGWEVDLRVQGIFGRWAELVGADVARHTTPESFERSGADGGTLVVRTDSTAWATEMRLLSPSVIHRLNLELGHGTVGLIDVRGPHAPSWKKGRLSVRDGRGPRDTYG